MTPKNKTIIQKQLAKIESISAFLPAAYRQSLLETVRMIRNVVECESDT